MFNYATASLNITISYIQSLHTPMLLFLETVSPDVPFGLRKMDYLALVRWSRTSADQSESNSL